MITWELIVAISAYNFVMYATPGPNNSILTTSGIKFGEGHDPDHIRPKNKGRRHCPFGF